MLNVAYCRVSTEEQAAEGFSIDGQAEKLRAYAQLHDLGPVTVIQDPGRSGKNLERPGLQQLLAMVEEGHVSNVFVWRLDRLSRNLGDLILLAETLGKHEVGLHSFTEKLDLSSATGRMFYNILGAFAVLPGAARRERPPRHAPGGPSGQVGEPPEVRIRPRRRRARRELRRAHRPEDLRPSRTRSQLYPDRRAHRREVLHGPGDRALPHLSRGGALQR